MSNRSNSLLPAVWMISAAFCFASMGAMTHAVGSRCDWLLIAFIRIVCTFIFSVGLARAAGARLVVWKPRTLWMRSVAGTISLTCTFYALTRLPVADVLTLTNTYPLWIVLMSFRDGTKRNRWADLACVVCGVLGVVLIQRPEASGHGDVVAVLIALGASVTTAIAMLGLHRLREVDARAVVAHFSGLASLTLAVWLLFAHPIAASALAMDGWVIWLLLGVGLTGTLGQVFLTRAYAFGSPSKIAVLSLTQVVFGMGFDVTFLGRQLTFTTLVGFAMVLGPTAWITTRSAARAEQKGVAPEPTPEPEAAVARQRMAS